MVRYMLPVSVVTNTGGTFVGTGNHNDLNDQNNATYWWTGDNTAETLEVKMTDFSASPPAYGFMSYSTVDTYADGGVVPADSGNTNAVFNVSIYQGTTLIYNAGNEVPNSGAWSTDSYTVNFDFSSITDWSDVRVRIVTSGGGGSPAGRRGVALSRISLEIPNAGTSPSWKCEDYRFYNDDSATWANITAIAAQNTAASMDAGADFILAINFGDISTTTGWDSTGYPLLQYAINGGAWTTVTTTTDVRIVDSANYAQGNNNGLKLGGLSGTTLGSPGSYFVDTSEATGSYKWDNHSREYHYRLKLFNVSGSDVITFRMLGTDTDVPSTRPVATMAVTPTINVNAAATQPTWAAEDYRFYAPEAIASATALAAENTGISRQADEPFILVMNVGETADATANNTGVFGLQYRVNGGSWVAVGSAGAAIDWANNVNTEGQTFTSKLSTLTGAATQQGTWNQYKGDAATAFTSQTWTDDSAEMAWGLRIRADAGLANSDSITFSVVSPQTTTIVPTNIPTITYSSTAGGSTVRQEKNKNGTNISQLVANTGDGWVAPTAGNLLVIGVMTTDDAIDTVTDNSGAGSWARAVQSLNTTNTDSAEIWWKIANGSETSFTVTNTGATQTNMHMLVMEIVGPWNPSPVDQTATQSETTTTSHSTGTTGTTTQANEFAVAVLAGRTSQTNYKQWTNDFIERIDVNEAADISNFAVATKQLAATGTVTTSATSAASILGWGAIATFKRGNNGSLTRTLDTATVSDGTGDVIVSGDARSSVRADSTAWTADQTVITADAGDSTTLRTENAVLVSAGTVAAQGGVNGSADITLAAVAISSAGTVDVAGSASITTGAATSSSAGTVDIVGSGDITLAAATLSSAGGVELTGALTRTLADVTISAAGGSEVSGSLAKTLDDATLTSAADVEVTGDADVTLAAATASSAGTVDITGSSSITLEVAAVSSAGTVDVTGDADITLGAVAIDSAGVVGNPPVEGTANITLAAVAISADGDVEVTGALDRTLDSATISAAGTAEVAGSAAITLADATISSAGTVDVAGAADITLDNVAVSAAGTVVDNTISGNADITLAPATVSSAGTVELVGSLDVALGAAAAAAAGAVEVVGSLSRTLADVAISATGELATGSTGDADITLAAASAAGAGTVDVTGTSSVTLGDATLVGGDPRQVAAGGGGWSKDWLRAFEEWLRPVKVRKRKPKSALARSVEQVLRANFEPEPVKLPPPPPRPPKLAPQATAVEQVHATIEARATLQVGSCGASGRGETDWSGEDEELMLLY